jgi:GNAT superfamily N-acetyltransferase
VERYIEHGLEAGGGMGISYRETVPEREHFFELFQSTGWNKDYHLEAGEIHAALEHTWYSVSAYDDDRLVGYGRVLSDGKLHALIVEMIVLPSYRGRGIGSAILDKMMGRCKAHKIRDIQLFCAKGKVGFYERHGFFPRPEEAPGMQYPVEKALG